MNTQELIERQKFDWHIRNNVFNNIDDKTADHIWSEIKAVNAGEKTLSDFIPDGQTTIGEMIEDLQLDFFIKKNETF